MHHDRAVLGPRNIFQDVSPGAMGCGDADAENEERKSCSHESFNPHRAEKLRSDVVFHKAELRLGVKSSAVKFAAAFQARDGPLDRPNPGEILAAARTTIEEPPRPLFHRKREGVATLFVRDAKVATGFSPLRPMRWDASSAGAELGEEMGQFMAQGAIDLRSIMLTQARVQRDQVSA